MFEIGREYHRKTEIHDVYGGQAYGGISTPKNHGFVMLVSSSKGASHGYEDRFIKGLFHYTGEGQTGDMTFSKGNKAIRDHIQNGKQLYLFEQKRSAYVTCRGEAVYEGHYWTERPDTNGDLRQAIVFKLSLMMGTENKIRGSEFSQIKLSSLTQSELRNLALNGLPQSTERTYSQFIRSEALKRYVKKRANGVCEGCNTKAPFSTSTGPYLECHHIHFLSDGGPDLPENVAGLCPNCHRKAHLATDKEHFNNELKAFVENLECEV